MSRSSPQRRRASQIVDKLVVTERRSAGELEAEVLGALWAAVGPMTPGQVREVLGGELAYTTVLSVLSRLHTKGVVVRDKVGRAHAYSPSVAEAELTARRMQDLLQRGDDRAGVLQRFVAGLSRKDRALLGEFTQQLGDR